MRAVCRTRWIVSPSWYSVGDRIHLHPVWMIFAVLAGTVLFGFLGTLLAVPVAGVLGVLIRFALAQYKASRLYRVPVPVKRGS